MKTKPNVIITGASGQIGSHLADLYVNAGYDVIGLVRRRATENNENLYQVLNDPNFKLVEGDITDPTSINNLIREYKPDLFINTAAMSHVHTSFSQPKLTFQVNLDGVLNCLEGIKSICPKTKFLTFSSSEMFGGAYSVDDKGKYQDEETKFYPKSPYAISKVAAHHLVKNYRESYDLFASTIIMHNQEGKRRGKKFLTRKVSEYVAKLYHFKYNCGSTCSYPKLKLGTLDTKRDFGYAPDAAIAVKMILDHSVPDDFMIATGESYSIEDFVRQAFLCIGIRNWQDYIEISDEFKRPSEVKYLCGRANKIEKELGWTPRVKFYQLVQLMVESDINHGLEK